MQEGAHFGNICNLEVLGPRMNLADGIILCVVFVSAFFGLWRGFVREVFSVVNWIAAFIVANLFSPGMQQVLEGHIEAPGLRSVAAFGILFVMTLIIGGIASRLLVALVRFTGLGGTDRSLGMAFGVLRGLLIVVVLVAMGQQMFNKPDVEWWQASSLIPHFQAAQHSIWELFSQFLSWVTGTAAGSEQAVVETGS